MPITTHRNPARNLTTFECDGNLSFIEIVAVINRFFQGTITPPTKKIQWDMRNASIASLTVDHVYHIANLMNDYQAEAKGTKTAIVVSEDISFDIAINLETETKEALKNLIVFRKIAEATEWLEIELE